jgi:hypothetical protein
MYGSCLSVLDHLLFVGEKKKGRLTLLVLYVYEGDAFVAVKHQQRLAEVVGRFVNSQEI